MSKDSRSGLPGRVDAALEYLNHCRWIEQDDTAKRELSGLEERVRGSALEVLRLYFAGEMNFGDAPVHRREDEDGEPEPAHAPA